VTGDPHCAFGASKDSEGFNKHEGNFHLVLNCLSAWQQTWFISNDEGLGLGCFGDETKGLNRLFHQGLKTTKELEGIVTPSPVMGSLRTAELLKTLYDS
jgi:hypothetical protein